MLTLIAVVFTALTGTIGAQTWPTPGQSHLSLTGVFSQNSASTIKLPSYVTGLSSLGSQSAGQLDRFSQFSPGVYLVGSKIEKVDPNQSLPPDQIRISNPTAEERRLYGGALWTASNIMRLVIKDIDSEIYERLGGSKLLVFLFPPDRDIASHYYFKELEPGSRGVTRMVPVPYKLEDGTEIMIPMIVIALGVENLLDEVPANLKFAKYSKYYILLHEFGHAIHNVGLTDDRQRDVKNSWTRLYSQAKLYFTGDTLRLFTEHEYAADSLAYWFGAETWLKQFPIVRSIPGGTETDLGPHTSFGWFAEGDRPMNRLLTKLFNKKGPYDAGYIAKELKKLQTAAQP